MNIENAHVIVTGGSAGIGKATAALLATKNTRVVITGRDSQKLQRVATELGVIPVPFDISDLAAIPVKSREIIDRLDGKVDVLINNAGTGIFPPLGEITEQQLLEVFRTNVFGLTLFTQEIVSVFRAQNYGNIINIGSTASLKGFARGSIYAASKFALRALSQTWQAELRSANIRVTQVNPSEVTTAFANPERNERPEEANKLGPQDIAHAIVSVLEMRNKGFVPEITVWATNPF